MMAAPSPAAEFSESQWRQAKSETWDFIRAAVASRPPQRILYIGCGRDVQGPEFAAQGHLFVNVDIISEMLVFQAAQSGGNPNIINIAADIHALPFAPGSFDYIIALDVLHHEYREIPELLAKLLALLAPGGTIFLQDPNAWGFYQLPKTLLLPKPL
ncbi:MAG: class I SAM-dependent methyltransferase, partial [Candidatus Magasanikbacteria bacterium]|nr:class I SAM-dependent methyltransferase [Candidatus Magasanikbacteria bacterium]